MPDDRASAEEAAAKINQLIVELWMATERRGPRFDEFDLTGQQHAVLGLIVTEPGIRPLGLASALGVTRGAISQHLANLERLGYIKRQRGDRDRRVQVLRLQELGERYQRRWREFERYAVDRYLAELTPTDLTEIVAALTKLKRALTD